MFETQVEKSHYAFPSYMSKQRWSSIWHQLDEIQRLKPESVLELGPGPGIFKAIAAQFGIAVETLDIDPELKPDHVASATAMPFKNGAYDVVCAFQMLEHLPYECSLEAFREMVRVSRKNVVISLPDAKKVYPVTAQLPRLGEVQFLCPRPFTPPPVHHFDGEHYWEVNKSDYALDRIILDFTRCARLIKTYRVTENPYHRFFVFET